jgi:amino acid transporter
LKRAGPLGLLLGYGAFGSITWMTFNAMGEMVCYLPVDGSFITFAYRFVDPSFGFALGWLYCYNAACVVAAEITAVASMVNFWNSSINNAAWCGISLAVVFGLVSCPVGATIDVRKNLLGAKYFGEGEFVLSIFKVLLILGLLIFTRTYCFWASISR